MYVVGASNPGVWDSGTSMWFWTNNIELVPAVRTLKIIEVQWYLLLHIKYLLSFILCK